MEVTLPVYPLKTKEMIGGAQEHFHNYKGNEGNPYHNKSLYQDGISLLEPYNHLYLCRNLFPHLAHCASYSLKNSCSSLSFSLSGKTSGKENFK